MKAERRSWKEALLVYRQRSVLSMLFLGFSAGLPFYLVFQTLSAWLRQEGIERATIGMLALGRPRLHAQVPVVADRGPLQAARAPHLARQAPQLDARRTGRHRIRAAESRGERAGERCHPDCDRGLVPGVLLGDAGHRNRRLAHRVSVTRPAGRDGRGLPARLSRCADHGRRRRARHRAGLRLGDELHRHGDACRHRHRDDLPRARAGDRREADGRPTRRRGSLRGSPPARTGRSRCGTSAPPSSAP